MRITRVHVTAAVLAVSALPLSWMARAAEEPIPATYVETRDDRVLRFETLRAALATLAAPGQSRYSSRP